MNYTVKQQSAIDTTGSNIIVSAGAGSGKTAVLSQRVYEHVIKRHINIDEMLIVTFTNAAAFEMKKRIRKKLVEDESLSLEEKNKQINKIDSSYIMTFDAYALSLVKKYHYLLNVDKNVSIIDSSISTIKLDELLDQIMLENYENINPQFEKLVKDFCIKNDQKIKDTIKMLYYKLQLIYDIEGFINDYKTNYFSKEKIDFLFNEYERLIQDKVNVIRSKINELSYSVDIEKTYKNIDSFLASSSYEEIRQSVTNIEIGRLSKADEQTKNLKKEIKDLIDEVNKLTSSNKEVLLLEYENIQDDVLCLLNIANELNRRMFLYKKENSLFDFNDIFKMAIEIVDKHDDIRCEIKDYFKEILIDEYQDTNDLQDLFISKIENNNVYMVGDIKQSIYRFRNANPNLFKNKYLDYKNGNNGIAIELPDNFRSRKGVLEAINVIFEKLMDLDIGGADYKNGHALLPGQVQYEKNILENQNDQLEIYNYSFEKDDYPFNALKKELVEAFIIGQDINEKVKNGYKVSDFDEKGNMILRNCRYSDFTILMDRGTSYDDYKKILTYLNIPCVIQEDEKISKSDLTSAIIAFFKLLNCQKEKDFNNEYKMAYSSLSRNFLVETKDADLYDEIKKDQFVFSKLYSIIEEVCINIEKKTISDLLDEFVLKFDVYSKLVKIGDIKENLVKLDYFYQLAHNLSNSGYDYKTFALYLNSIIDPSDNNDIKFSIKKDNENAVLITNIHKSKGLEYPILYLPTLTRKFNNQDINTSIAFKKQYGCIISSMIENKGLKDTFIKKIYCADSKKEDVSEKIRLFYVALTRAKEKIIMVAPLEDKQVTNELDSNQKIEFNSFVDMLNSIYEDLDKKGYIKNIDLNQYTFDLNYSTNIRDIFNHIEVNNKTIVYKHGNHYIPEEISESSFSKKTGLLDKEVLKKMEFGTKLHYYLETLDFVSLNFDGIEERYLDKIKAFLGSDLMANIQNGKPYKEYEFIYEEENELKHGFIDLLVEYDDHFDIIDYKLKNIDDENYDKQLKGYKAYISSISDKKVYCYLYSIMDKNYREVL